MHKGLKSTLMTVAVALLGLKAMAMAPTIGQLPDVLIGDEFGASGGATVGASMDNNFVFPDAYDVDSKVTDDNTSAGAIRWSFMNPGGHYSINARTRLDGSAENLDNPSANYSIDGGDDPDSVDANKRTLSFRNIQFSPLPKPASYPDPGTPVGVPSDPQQVTLVASDGSTHTTASFTAYIVNDGNDALSPSGGGTNVLDHDLTQPNGWLYQQDVATGAVSHTGPDVNGLCVTVAAEGVNIIGWSSQDDYIKNGVAGTPYNTVSLVDNAVYRARLTVATTAQPGFVPAWYFGHQNSIDLYGGAYIFFDSGVNPNAGANTPPAAGTRAIFEAVLNAPGVGTSAFKTEVFKPANAATKDMRLKFRTLDVGSTGDDPYGAASDVGTICWKHVTIDRFDLSSLQIQSVVYNNTAMVQAVDAAAGTANTQAGAVTVLDFSGAGNSTVTFTGGGIDFAPTAAGASTWNTLSGNGAFFLVNPGDSRNAAATNEMIDNYPVPWDTDQLYRIVYSLVAPNALSESNPPDFYFLGGDVLTNDLITNTYGTTKMNLANMPKQGTPQEFMSFWHGNNRQTSTADVRFNNMRPHIQFGTNNGFVDVPNTGGFGIRGIRVEKVALP
jgi:hypothetical protein